MNAQKAIEIAGKHIAQRNREHSVFGEARIHWYVVKPVEYSDFRYFEYEFDTLCNSDVMLVGSPGYAVSKSDGSVNTVSWQEHLELNS